VVLAQQVRRRRLVVLALQVRRLRLEVLAPQVLRRRLVELAVQVRRLRLEVLDRQVRRQRLEVLARQVRRLRLVLLQTSGEEELEERSTSYFWDLSDFSRLLLHQFHHAGFPVRLFDALARPPRAPLCETEQARDRQVLRRRPVVLALQVLRRRLVVLAAWSRQAR
jgi:hypothetical protein